MAKVTFNGTTGANTERGLWLAFGPGSRIEIEGETFPIKSALQLLGFRWDSIGFWYYRVQSQTDAIRMLKHLKESAWEFDTQTPQIADLMATL